MLLADLFIHLSTYTYIQEPAPPSKAQEKYDEIEMAYVRPYPKDFTKVSS